MTVCVGRQEGSTGFAKSYSWLLSWSCQGQENVLLEAVFSSSLEEHLEIL